MDSDFKRARRPYANMIITSRQAPQSQPLPAHQPPIAKKGGLTFRKFGIKKKYLVWSSVMTALLVVSLGIFLVFFKSSDPSGPLSDYAKKQKIPFEVYYPEQAIDSFKLNNSSVSYNSGVLTFSGTYKNKTLVIIEQPLPDQFDYDLVSSAKDLSLKKGKGYVLELGNKSSGLLLIDKTFVTISGPNADLATIEQLLKKF